MMETLSSPTNRSIHNTSPVDGRRSSNNAEDQSTGERESNRQHSSRGKKSMKRARLLVNKGQAGMEEKRNAMMVVSVLLATLTFQASLNPPGGFWQDDKSSESGNYSRTATVPSPTDADNEGHKAGTAINAIYNGLNWFLICNTVGLFASLLVILLLTSAITIKRQRVMWVVMIIMWIAIFSVAFSFACGVLIILRDLSNPTVKYIIAFLLGCMLLFAGLVILHLFIGLKKVKGWLKKTVLRRQNEGGAPSPSLPGETA